MSAWPGSREDLAPYTTLADLYLDKGQEISAASGSRKMFLLPASGALRTHSLPHINDYAKLAVAPSTNPAIPGLGLYALGGLSKGDTICLFTGVWAFESDVDKVFGLEEPCIHNYASSFDLARAVVRAETLLPDKDACNHLAADRLMCMPRVTRGGPTSCKIVCDVRSGICDVGALLNAASREEDVNCELVPFLVNLPIGEGPTPNRERAFAAIAVQATRNIPAYTPHDSDAKRRGFTELLLNYGYDAADPSPAMQYKQTPWNPATHAISPNVIEKALQTGRKITRRVPNAIARTTCGPPCSTVECSSGTGTAEGLVVYQPTGSVYRAYLRARVIF